MYIPALVGASTLAMVVNDNAGNLAPRGALGFIASLLAPTDVHPALVGASTLAMVVKDNAGNLAPRVLSGSSRACSLLQMYIPPL
ncbi:hypothetical protein DM828_26045 [Pseudomonas umsongensis]|nr:hypothetical protein [Pseudomonas umsongensis]